MGVPMGMPEIGNQKEHWEVMLQRVLARVFGVIIEAEKCHGYPLLGEYNIMVQDINDDKTKYPNYDHFIEKGFVIAHFQPFSHQAVFLVLVH